MSATRILLIESVLEDALFVQEALAEAQETREAAASCYCLHLESVDDAIALLEREPYDVVLFAIDEADREKLDEFVRLRKTAQNIPVILLIEPRDRGFAKVLLRHGAQDYLLKPEIDCGPLARAVENAIERQRLVSAAQSVAMLDSLTGLTNDRAFVAVGERELRLIRRSGEAACLILAEVDSVSDMSLYDRDLALLGAAEALKAGVGEDPLVGRYGETRFAILSARPDPAPVISGVQNAAERNMSGLAFQFGWAVATEDTGGIETLLAKAEEDLCENRLAYQLD